MDHLEEEEDEPIGYLDDMEKYLKIYEGNVKPLV